MLDPQRYKPFERLSIEYISFRRRSGLSGFDILNSYTQQEIVEWFHRGMTCWYEQNRVSGFRPMEHSFLYFGDWDIKEGVYRICNSKQIKPWVKKYICREILRSLVNTPHDEASLMLFDCLCQLAVDLVPAAKILRQIPSLLRGQNQKAYTERLRCLRNMAHDLSTRAPMTSARMYHMLIREQVLDPESLGIDRKSVV